MFLYTRDKAFNKLEHLGDKSYFQAITIPQKEVPCIIVVLKVKQIDEQRRINYNYYSVRSRDAIPPTAYFDNIY